MQENLIAFVDRDGVINHDSGYTYKVEDFKFLPGSLKGLKEISDRGYSIIIITNQAGIAKGHFTLDQYLKFSRHLESLLKINNINFLKTYFCPHHKNAIVTKYKKDCFNRKPNPGMIYKAKKEFNIDLSKSILIGDKLTDVHAGLSAKINKIFLVTSDSKQDNKDFIPIKKLTEIKRYI